MFSTAVSRRVSEFLGVVLFAVALVWLIALATFDPQDAVWFFNTGGTVPPANFVGQVGSFLAEVSFQTVGYAAYLIPIFLLVFGWHYFWCRTIDAAYTKLVGFILLAGCTASFLSLAFGTIDLSENTFQAGGYLGDWLADTLALYLNRTGSVIVVFTLLFLSIILSTQFSFGRLFTSLGHYGRRWNTKLLSAARQWVGKRQRDRERAGAIRDILKKKALLTLGKTEPPTDPPVLKFDPQTPPEDPKKKRRPERPISHVPTTGPPPQLPFNGPASPPKSSQNGPYSPPPAALLDSPKTEQKFDDRLLMENAKLLEEKCSEFAVEGAVVQIHPGPVVTTFEFKPEAGVKYNKVTSLAEDLCLALQADSVFIERIPGKSTVGIQIPNRTRDQISLRQLLEYDVYGRSTSKLTLALGKTIHGEPLVSDLAKMPHLLIAGATGTGKSVAMNAMLTSILFRATPSDVRLILIDPKRLELGMYEDIPHLLTPVVVDPKKAANALRWAVREMEERYKRLASEGVRNIDQYNRNVNLRAQERKKTTSKPDSDILENEYKPLPYVVLAIDELADLMMVASNEVEESIARLAQMARAVGIHLILATQRPSVDVITGLIKANLPSRIAFRVSSKVDSRTILDANGAEQLLGKGDMLYLPPASSRCIRLHGPYISEQETARLASFLRRQGQPGYDETITADDKAPENIEFQRDDLYEQASKIVVTSGQASISHLQRRLRIGFSRAARLVDMMEADGLVSSGTAGKPRELLVKPDYFEEIDLQPR